MNMCRHHQIELWNIQKKESFIFSIKAKEFGKTVPIVYKSGIRPHIREKKGFPFCLAWCMNNWTFCSGFLFFLALLVLLSSYVWEISFQGQSTYTKETLQKTVNEMGVSRGMKRSRLVCDDIEKNIRKIYPDISWVSAEEKGSRLVISIKEAEKTVKRTSEETPCHVIASCDGTIQKISVNRGVAMVKKGQRVKKGQILISGVLSITDDADVVVKKIAVAAKGNVQLLVSQDIKKPIKTVVKEKEYTGRRVMKYEWKVGNQSFSIKNPFKRFHNSSSYDIITTKKLDTKIQPLNFPLQMEQYEYREYRWKKVTRSRAQIKTMGEQYWQRWQQKMRKRQGVCIVNHSLRIQKDNGKDYTLVGTVTYTDENMNSCSIRKEECQVERKVEDEEHG